MAVRSSIFRRGKQDGTERGAPKHGGCADYNHGPTANSTLSRPPRRRRCGIAVQLLFPGIEPVPRETAIMEVTLAGCLPSVKRRFGPWVLAVVTSNAGATCGKRLWMVRCPAFGRRGPAG